MMEKLDDDAALDAAARVNTRENVRLTFDQKVEHVIQEIVDSNFELYKRITDDRAFGEAIKNFLFDQYLRAHRNAEELIKRGESKTLEFKSTLRWSLKEDRQDDKGVTHAVLKTIAAFLNTEGGDLLIGVADDGAIVGIEHDQLENDDKFMRHLAQVVRNGLGDRAGTCIDPKTQIVQGKTVCVVSCQRSPEPVFLKWKGMEDAPDGDFFVRSGPGTVKLPPESARRVHSNAVRRVPSRRETRRTIKGSDNGSRRGHRMSYFMDLFSPETYEAFAKSDRTISGFRPRQRNIAQRIRPGDKLVCYMTRLSRWIGILEVENGPFNDATPIFYPEADPFTVRFRVRAKVWLPLEKTVPIHASTVWGSLSFTSKLPHSSTAWTGKVRGSLVALSDADGEFLESLLARQATAGQEYALDSDEQKKLRATKIRRLEKDVTVTVPEDAEPAAPPVVVGEVRESIRIQALLAEVGSRMGLQIWIPRSDRAAVETEWRRDHPPILDRLPLNYDDTTLRTIEQIDVLWLKGRSIKRAFEVEHTTSVYSGILRMADLLALQPNMDIRLHIVAPPARREKVFQEILRPVFSLLDRGPLSESCTFVSYESVRELADQQHLEHLSDTVLDEYEEQAGD